MDWGLKCAKQIQRDLKKERKLALQREYGLVRREKIYPRLPPPEWVPLMEGKPIPLIVRLKKYINKYHSA